MFAIKRCAYVDLTRLAQLRMELKKYGYPNAVVENTYTFLESALNHPLIYDVNGPDWLLHATTCYDGTHTIQLVDHCAKLIKLSDTPIAGPTWRGTQCAFDFKGRWPKGILHLDDYPSTTSIGKNSTQWLLDHQDVLLSVNERIISLDLVRFTPLLDAYTSYPLLL